MGGSCASKRMSTTLPRTATTTPRFEELVLFSMGLLHFSFRRIGASLRRQGIGQLQTCHPSAVVGHQRIQGCLTHTLRYLPPASECDCRKCLHGKNDKLS